jgi:hypothetical protein
VERSSHPSFRPSTVRPKVPFWRPSAFSASLGPPPSALAPYRFRHSGRVYDVRFTPSADKWIATLHRDGDESGRPLIGVTDELAAELYDVAIENGFTSVAEWLVTTGQWSDRTDTAPRSSALITRVFDLQPSITSATCRLSFTGKKPPKLQ